MTDSTVTGQREEDSNVTYDGNWIIRDLGTHKVFGIPSEFTSPVAEVALPSGKLDWEQSREQEPHCSPPERQSESTHEKPNTLDSSR